MPETIVHPTVIVSDPLTFSAPALEPPLMKALYSAMQWWEMYGLWVYYAPLKLVWLTESGREPIDLTMNNPWGKVYQNVIGDTGLGVPPHHKHLVFLQGWDNQSYLGWGGDPLALVGEYVLRAFLSMGAPEAIMDDVLARNVVLHETGHVLGLSHDAPGTGGIMHDWWLPEAKLLVKPWQAALSGSPGAASACILPL